MKKYTCNSCNTILEWELENLPIVEQCENCGIFGDFSCEDNILSASSSYIFGTVINDLHTIKSGALSKYITGSSYTSSYIRNKDELMEIINNTLERLPFEEAYKCIQELRKFSYDEYMKYENEYRKKYSMHYLRHPLQPDYIV